MKKLKEYLFGLLFFTGLMGTAIGAGNLNVKGGLALSLISVIIGMIGAIGIKSIEDEL